MNEINKLRQQTVESVVKIEALQERIKLLEAAIQYFEEEIFASPLPEQLKRQAH